LADSTIPWWKKINPSARLAIKVGSVVMGMADAAIADSNGKSAQMDAASKPFKRFKKRLDWFLSQPDNFEGVIQVKALLTYLTANPTKSGVKCTRGGTVETSAYDLAFTLKFVNKF